MIGLHFLISFLIYLFVVLPCVIVSYPVVFFLLFTCWDGRSTIFGNAKHGLAPDHYAYPTRGEFWREFIWLVWRNPVYNWTAKNLAVRRRGHFSTGNTDIGDKIAGGFYKITMKNLWEYYWIKPYTIFGSRRCIRARIGWKIWGGKHNELAEFVFSINPFKLYLGI